MKLTPAKTLSKLPPYLFVRLNALKRKAEAEGLDVIDLGQGSPDLPSPEHVVEALRRSVGESWTHRYPQANGSPAYRQAVADWYRGRFGVRLDPETEVLPLIGSKEGLGHLFAALLNPGDGVLVPSPCYPVHYNGVILAGGRAHFMPLKEENGFWPRFERVPARHARESKALILNYPNNPTGAVAPGAAALREALDFAEARGCLLVYDNAYSELTFDDYVAPSILQIPGAKRLSIEFHSLSKTYSMAGWRLGFAVGNAEAVGMLTKYKGFIDYGIPAFLQEAGIAALSGPQDCVERSRKQYQSRRDALLASLARFGWSVKPPKAAMYVWAPLPEEARRLGSLAFAERLILEHGVVLAPGVGFGPDGEGYVRFSLIASEERLREAARRVGDFLSELAAPRRPAARSR